MHKSQVLFYILLSFVLGILITSFAAVSYEAVLVLTVIGIGSLALFSYQKTYSLKGIYGSVFLLFFIFGVWRLISWDLSNSILPQFADLMAGDKPITLSFKGYVDEEPRISAQTTQFKFKTKEIILPDRTLEINEKTQIIVNGMFTGKVGDRLEIKGAVSAPQNFNNGFDYVRYLKKEGIKTVVLFPEITEGLDLKLGAGERFWIKVKRITTGVSLNFQGSVSKALAEPNASYVNGILLGSRQDIPDDLREAFNKTGTTHILAISGYNIMIIVSALLAGLVFFVRRRTAFWISMVVIFLFTIMTGASSSVVRASVMGLLILFAQGYGRMYDAKNSIILAGAVMIYYNPFALVFDIGFQLSFLAVIGLLYLYPILKEKFEKYPPLFGLKDILLTTVSAQAMVILPIIFYFGRFSWVFLPANVLILPLIPYAMLTGLMAGLGQVVLPSIAQFIAIPAWAITSYQIWIVRLLS